MTHTLQQLVSGQAVDLLNANVDGIANELRESIDGKLSVSISFKVTLAGDRLLSTGGLGYSRKFKCEIEGSADIDDPKQLRLKLTKEH